MLPERGRQLLYLSRANIEAIEFSVPEVIAAVENAFREKAAGRFEMPPKPGLHPRPDAFIHAMPAYLPGPGAAGIKWVAGYPGNRGLGLPYITGLLVLNCPETGVPLAVMDCAWITEKRTAAATAVAVRPLGVRPRRLAIIGAGVQGRANTVAVRAVCPGLEVVAVFDPNEDARLHFEREVRLPGLSIEQPPTAEAAVRDADIVVSCAPIVRHPDPVVAPGWLKPGAVGVSLDFDATFQAETARAVDGIWVDDGPQFEYYRNHGHFAGMPEKYREVFELVTGDAGRKEPAERHLIVNLGLALEDIMVAQALYRRALERGIGTVLSC